MKIATRVVIDMESGAVLEWEGYEYEGPLDLCGRSESKQAFQQSQAQSAQNQANAQANLSATTQGLADYQKRLGGLSRAIARRYGAGGEYQATQNTINNEAASAGSKALGADLALRSARTGENGAGFATAAAEDRRARQRDLTTQMAQSEADRLKTLTALQGQMLDQSKFPAEVSAGLYGTSVGGANAAGGNATSAAKVPGFWDVFAPALVGGAAAVGKGFTPGGAAAG